MQKKNPLLLSVTSFVTWWDSQNQVSKTSCGGYCPPPPTHTHFYGNQSRELEDPNPFYLQVIFRAQYHKALAHCDESRKGDLSGGRQHPGQTSHQDQSSENESR